MNNGLRVTGDGLRKRIKEIPVIRRKEVDELLNEILPQLKILLTKAHCRGFVLGRAFEKVNGEREKNGNNKLS